LTKRLHVVALVTAAGALLAVPAIGQADPPTNGAHSNHGKSGKSGKSCLDRPTVKKGFVVKGTLVSYNPGTAAAGDETVTLTVTKMNKHAQRAGLTDTDGGTAGTQYTIAGGPTDPFTVQASGYDPTATPADVPSAGDKVRVIGKVAVTRKKCDRTATLAERYGTVNVRKVKIIDATPDAAVAPVVP